MGPFLQKDTLFLLFFVVFHTFVWSLFGVFFFVFSSVFYLQKKIKKGRKKKFYSKYQKGNVENISNKKCFPRDLKKSQKSHTPLR